MAGALGLPYAVAHHITPSNTLPALARYRVSFRPSAMLDRLYAMVAAGAICANTDEDARFLAGSFKLTFVELSMGKPPGPLPTPEEAAAYSFSGEEQKIADEHPQWLLGSPDTILEAMRDLLKRIEADELMLLTYTHDPVARTRSFQFIADAVRRDGPRKTWRVNARYQPQPPCHEHPHAAMSTTALPRARNPPF